MFTIIKRIKEFFGEAEQTPQPGPPKSKPKAKKSPRPQTQPYNTTSPKKQSVKPRKRKKKPLKLPKIIDIPREEGKTRFLEFFLKNTILAGLQDAKFKYCTPIQEKCIPHLLQNKDIAGKAQTGTGKTAAFLISIFMHLLNNPPKSDLPGFCRVLIIAPTRELAIQIFKDAEKLGKYCGLTNAVVYGGMDYQKQKTSLKRHIDILIGTPGRLLDYSRNRVVKLSKTEIFVIDEADRMLDMGFIPDVRRIVGQLPHAEKRQTMLFSATLSEEIMRLVRRWQVSPIMVEIEPEQIVTDLIEQICYSVLQDNKRALLMWLIKSGDVKKALIFVNRRDFTTRLKSFLHRKHIKCDALSSDIPQKKRLTILEDFRKGTTPIIIATDVASRGIHVDDITHVINYDMPERPEDYIHRIGRTGRAGRKGKAISFICEYGAYVIPELEQLLDSEIKSIQPTPEMLK